MVFRIVQRGEVVPVGLDLRAVGNGEAYRAEDLLDALPRANDRVDAAAPASAPWKGDIERLLGEALGEPCIGKLAAARLEGLLDALLGRVVSGPRGLSLLDGKRRKRFLKCKQVPVLAEEPRLRVLEGRGIAGRAECGERAVDDAREGANGSGWL